MIFDTSLIRRLESIGSYTARRQIIPTCRYGTSWAWFFRLFATNL